MFSKQWSSAKKSYPYSLLILATDVAAFNLHPEWQDMQPQLKQMLLLSNQQQMVRIQGFPSAYCNKLLTLPWESHEQAALREELDCESLCKMLEERTNPTELTLPPPHFSFQRRWLAKGTRHELLGFFKFYSQKDLSLRVLC